MLRKVIHLPFLFPPTTRPGRPRPRSQRTNAGDIGRLNPATGAITLYPIPNVANPNPTDIIVGPDSRTGLKADRRTDLNASLRTTMD
jgi:hypothetical protein